MEDVAIQELLSRLARPHKSGGQVVERAAILAEGADFPAVLAWITAHAGEPETTVAVASSHGLHGPRVSDGNGGPQRAPHRYVLPASALA